MSDEDPARGSATSPRRTRQMGQVTVVLAMGIVVLLIAGMVIVIGMGSSGRARIGPAPLTTPTFPPGTLPPYKATIIARMQATFSATWTAEAAAPTATFTS